jgi:AcrR family transcriptional regulator
MSAGAESPGLHVRAGNAMGRTRDGLLDGALACIQRDGVRRTTMAGIAVRSGVAKATLYNHFRTKPELLRALVSREVDRIAELAGAARRAGSAADALDLAAAEVAAVAGGVAQRLAVSEATAVVPLLAPGVGEGWTTARQRAAEVLAQPADGPLVDLVLRWLAGQLIAPAAPSVRRASAELIEAGLFVTTDS